MGGQSISEPDQKPGLLIGHVLPYLCDHCMSGCQYSFAPAPSVSPFSIRGGEEGDKGEGEGRSTGAETIAETHTLPANAPLTIMTVHDRAASKAQVFDDALRRPLFRPWLSEKGC